MGLKIKTWYTIPALNIAVNTAYARITRMNIDLTGNVKAYADVQQIRDSIGNFSPLETHEINFTFDKLSNPYETAYLLLKAKLGDGWEDDNPAII